MAPVLYATPMSAPCRIVTMTADCLGLDYDYKNINLMAGEQMQPQFLSINPQHSLPTLVDGDLILNESRPIAGYLVNKYGKNDNLYPKDPVIRAKVDQRLFFDMGTFYQALAPKILYPVVLGKGPMPGMAELDNMKEILGWFEGFVKDGKFSAGTAYLTIADLSLLATYSTMKACKIPGVDLAQYRGVEAWYQKCVKQVPNYEKVCGEGAAMWGGAYQAKLDEWVGKFHFTAN